MVYIQTNFNGNWTQKSKSVANLEKRKDSPKKVKPTGKNIWKNCQQRTKVRKNLCINNDEKMYKKYKNKRKKNAYSEKIIKSCKTDKNKCITAKLITF